MKPIFFKALAVVVCIYTSQFAIAGNGTIGSFSSRSGLGSANSPGKFKRLSVEQLDAYRCQVVGSLNLSVVIGCPDGSLWSISKFTSAPQMFGQISREFFAKYGSR